MAETEYEYVVVRNNSFEPDLSREGKYLCRMPQPPPPPPGNDCWHCHLTPHERLYYHQTMNSVRFCKRFIPNPYIPKDSLEFRLQSRYDHGRESFPEKIDALLQRETCSAETSWLNVGGGDGGGVGGGKNGQGASTKGGGKDGDGDPGARRDVGVPFRILKNTVTVQIKKSDKLGHPLQIGGIKEKISPHSVKLICSGVHNQLVNNGFSRQTSDGNFFRY